MLSVENEGDWTDIITGVYNRSALLLDLDYAIRKKRRGYVLCLRLEHVDNRRLGFTMGAIARAIGKYHPWYNTFRITPSALLLHLPEEEEDVAVGLTEVVCRCMDRGVFVENDLVHCDYHVVRAGYPDEMMSLHDVLLMGEAELPPLKDHGRIYAGNDLQAIFHRAGVEEALHRGLAEHHFEVYYQPVHTTDGLILYAAEALIRLHDDVLGELYPDEFIPLAEKNGLINDIGAFVLEEVCRFIKSGTPDRLGMDHINVNISVVQCAQRDFVQRIRQTVDQYGVDPARINFEITESVAAYDYERLDRTIREFKDAGFKFSMDDYGTGYSNMQSIFMLDFDVIKIDKSILWEAQKSRIGRIILDKSVQMIRRMNRKILVEGVETPEQVQLLDELGVDYLQGYHFSRPVSEKEFVALYA